jgi:peptidoglycan hydrolase CwlO-like protein
MHKTAKVLTQWIGTPQSIILHTIFFAIMLGWAWLDNTNRYNILLVLTTVVSLEAIYQMLFLQLTVNQQGRELIKVQTAMDEVQVSVESVQEAVEEVQESVEEVHEEVQSEEIKGTIQEAITESLTAHTC